MERDGLQSGSINPDQRDSYPHIFANGSTADPRLSIEVSRESCANFAERASESAAAPRRSLPSSSRMVSSFFPFSDSGLPIPGNAFSMTAATSAAAVFALLAACPLEAAAAVSDLMHQETVKQREETLANGP